MKDKNPVGGTILFDTLNKMLDFLRQHPSFYLVSILWGACLCLSWIGWGRGLGRALSFPATDWAQEAAWGVALSALIGGLLNLAGLITPPIVLGFVFLGIIFFLFFNTKSWDKSFSSSLENCKSLWQEHKLIAVLSFVIIAIMVFRFSAWVFTPIKGFYNDDINVYLTFPVQMLQTGSLGDQPFSERRIDVLGGHSFLQVLLLSFLKIQNTHMLDQGLGYVLALGLLFGFARKKSLSPSLTFGVLLCFLLLVNPRNSNSSSQGMGLAIFLSLFRTVDEAQHIKAVPRCLMIALVAAALCSFKNTFAAFCGLYVLVMYGLRLVYSRGSLKNVFFEFSGVAVFGFLLLLPWMMASYYSSGTMLYPFLGQGYHRSAYGYMDFPFVDAASILAGLQNIFDRPCIIPLLALYFLAGYNPSKKDIWLARTLCVSAIILVSIWQIFFPKYDRYLLEFFFASFFTAVIYTIAGTPVNRETRRISLIMILLLLGCILGDPLGKRVTGMGPYQYWQNIVAGTSQFRFPDLDLLDEFSSYRKVQEVTPPGKVVLVETSRPFLFDFKRNPLWVADYITLGPPPGLPIFYGSGKAAQYLKSRGVRYVIYGYARRVSNRWTMLNAVNQKDNPWLQKQCVFTLKLQDILADLGKTRQKIYDDGQFLVLDLSRQP